MTFTVGLRRLGFALAALFLACSAFGQTEVAGQVRGRITDTQDRVVPGARVRITDRSRGFEESQISDDTGEYRFSRVLPGVYEVEATKEGLQKQVAQNVRVSLGNTEVVDFQMAVGQQVFVLDVLATSPVVDVERSRQADTFRREMVTDLPIDRRDYLTFALLAPGVADSKALADNSDFRVVQTPNSGLSFYGSNGRGNFVAVDGGEANDSSGGVRPTISQEAVEEFQVNRSNYGAELGGASGGVVNIISKSGNNDVRGTAFGFFRDDSFDATNPFANKLENGQLVRTKPTAQRQQFGGSLGFPLIKDKLFGFAAFERLHRNESSVVSLLTDPSIFEPTPEQERILATLPAAAAGALRQALTASPSTRALFEVNSGIFPFTTSDWMASLRLDYNLTTRDSLFFRYSFAHLIETNATVQALVGASRGHRVDTLDHTPILSWTRRITNSFVNEARFQWNYRGNDVFSLDPFGPQIDIPGFGFFNRETQLPSFAHERRYEVKDSATFVRGRHTIRFGGSVLARDNYSNPRTFGAGRFTFGPLPAGLVNPALASTTLTALQAFNLGLATTFQQGFGDTRVASVDPYYAVFVQDSFRVRPNLTLDIGLRYEVDDRRDPIRTDWNNVGPRFGFSWDPVGKGTTVVRGGYGIFYSQIYYQIDYVVNALSEINGVRPIAQIFTSIQTPGPAAANNIFTTLRAQGVIGVPTPTREVTAADLAQFGIVPTHTGPRPPFSVLFGISPDYVNPYAQQGSLGVEQQIAKGTKIAVNGVFVRTLKITRARDANLLPAAVDPRLGIRVWTPADFVDPALAQYNIYESTANASYAGLLVEFSHRATRNLSVAANYTFSKAIDDVVDYNSDFSANDQTNLRAEKALSSFDQRHKFTAYGVWNAFGVVEVSPILRATSGHPFNLLAGADLNADRHSTTDRPPFAGRNTGRGPDFWNLDLRLSHTFRLREPVALQVTAEAFNLTNRENFASVNNTVGAISGPFNLTGRADRSPSQPLGFTSVVGQRRIQLGARLFF